MTMIYLPPGKVTNDDEDDNNNDDDESKLSESRPFLFITLDFLLLISETGP